MKLDVKVNLEELIMVKKPYYKLYDLNISSLDNCVYAKVDNEYISENEGGPIGIGEFGRHVAILGSMALAKEYSFKEKYFFLATHARIKRTVSDIYEYDSFNLMVKALYTEKRKGKIYGEIYGRNDQLLFIAEVEYQVLSPSIFEKFFQKHYIDFQYNNTISPYLNRHELYNVSIKNDIATGTYGKVLANECEGHFKNYPALPVAIIGNLFIELGIQLFNSSLKSFKKVIVENAEINAKRLVFHGESLHFQAIIQKITSNSTMVVHCNAMVGTEIVADIAIKLRGIN